VAKVKKPKKELGIRKRLELRFGRKGSDEKTKEKGKEASPPPKGGEERIEPWRSTTSYRAEPRVLHGMLQSSKLGRPLPRAQSVW
jgi:hypothetical protein